MLWNTNASEGNDNRCGLMINLPWATKVGFKLVLVVKSYLRFICFCVIMCKLRRSPFVTLNDFNLNNMFRNHVKGFTETKKDYYTVQHI